MLLAHTIYFSIVAAHQRVNFRFGHFVSLFLSTTWASKKLNDNGPERGRQNAVRWKNIHLWSALLCAFENSDSVEQKKTDVRWVWGRRICQSYHFFPIAVSPKLLSSSVFRVREKKNCIRTDNLQQRITLRNRYLVRAAFCAVRYAFVAIIIDRERSEREREKKKSTNWLNVGHSQMRKNTPSHSIRSVKELTHTHRTSTVFFPFHQTSAASECVRKDVHFSWNTVNQT